jgi:hypothetical protein
MDDAAVPVIKPATDLTRLSGFLTSIGSFSEDMILYFDQKDTLYHYTNLDGLQAILSTSDIRLTNSLYCNDEAEMLHGLQLARETIAAEQSKATDPMRRSYLDELHRRSMEEKLEPVYICCFCESGEKLSQWRAYGANGTGVSLGFSPGEFSYITGPDCPPNIGLMRFWKVFYSNATQEKIVRSAINYYPQFEPAAAPLDWARWTWEAIQFFVPTFKHDDFREEEEWRLIFTPSPAALVPALFRVARGMLIPFYSLKELAKAAGHADRNLPLKSVRVGPSPSKELNAVSVEMLLKRFGYIDVAVNKSDTPYRG